MDLVLPLILFSLLSVSNVSSGCGCKMRPQALEEVLRGLPKCTDPNVLVGTDTSDDAGVYKITDDIALVQVLNDFSPFCFLFIFFFVYFIF